MQRCRVFRDFNVENLDKEVVEGLISEEELEDLESTKSGSPDREVLLLSQLRLRIMVVNTLKVCIIDLVSRGQKLEEELEDLQDQNLKLKQKVKKSVKSLQDVCSQTTEEDISGAEKLGTNSSSSLSESCGVGETTGSNSRSETQLLPTSLPPMDQFEADPIPTTDNDSGLEKKYGKGIEMHLGDSSLDTERCKEDSPGKQERVGENFVDGRALPSVAHRDSASKTPVEHVKHLVETPPECAEESDKTVSNEERDQLRVDSTDQNDTSGRANGSDEDKARDSSGHDTDSTIKETRHHKHSARDKSGHDNDSGKKRTCRKKAKVKKKSDHDRDNGKKDDSDEVSEKGKVRKKSKHCKDKARKDSTAKNSEKCKVRDKSDRKQGKGRKNSNRDEDRERNSSGVDTDIAQAESASHEEWGRKGTGDDEDRIWDWSSYYEDLRRTEIGCDEKKAWDRSEGGGDGEKDLVGGWDLSGTESIAQQVERVAAEALQGNSFVYDEQLGLYYDYSSGYYYNSEHGLYYDGKTGTYFFYDHVSKTYKFHSQVPVSSSDENKLQNDADDEKNVQETEGMYVKEEGECSNSDDDDEDKYESMEGATTWYDEEECRKDGESDGEIHIPSSPHGLLDHSESTLTSHIPPSLRLMVVGGGSASVKVGTLHLVTLCGGKVGRDKTNLVELPHLSISKIHAEFSYKSEGPDDHHYFVKDLGSINGTVVNGVRLSQQHQTSEPVEVGHGWMVEFGEVQIECHIHPGYLTCNECEPGIVLSRLPSEPSHKVAVSKEKCRKKQLNAIRKKYAISSRDERFITEEQYVDRAQKRRTEVGSDNPFEKTEIASTETALTDKNKGFALLQKMGWSKGTALGKSQTGIIEPIQAVSVVGHAGLGSSQFSAPAVRPDIKKRKRLNITQQRFKQASNNS